MGTWCIEEGDSLEILRKLPDACIDAVVTDPPAGIGFMGKNWDRMKREGLTELQAFQEFIKEIFTEVHRVLKPGGHAVVWAIPRTSHHTAMGIERAGFDIRDNGTYLFHVFGSGFPKSHSLKDEWQGWGTALKPAVEFWIVARKPLVGTVADNVMRYGTGALNIDGCRVGNEGGTARSGQASYPKNADGTENRSVCWARTGHGIESLDKGRWPANLIHDGSDEVLGLFPSSNGSGSARTLNRGERTNETGWGMQDAKGQLRDAGTGSAARFFYCAKASKRDRDEGLDALPIKTAGQKTDREDSSAGITAYAESRGPTRNSHPTVKPTDLMRYLCRLVTPPNGVVLDPFMGSGSTGKAALLEGFSFIGIDREPEYIEIARARLAHADASTA